MKKMTTVIILFAALFLNAKAPDTKTVYLIEPERINPYEAIWNATCTIETHHNPDAIDDLNFKEGSYGIAQIRRSRLLDYYQQTGIWYDVTDMFSIEKSKEVFMFYASQIDYRDTERIIREWNGGCKGMQKKATIKYYLKVKAML